MPGSTMPMSNVVVTARNQAGTRVDGVRTTATGTFSLLVPTLSGSVTISAAPWAFGGSTGYKSRQSGTSRVCKTRRGMFGSILRHTDPAVRSPSSPARPWISALSPEIASSPESRASRGVKIKDAFEGQPGGRPTAITPNIADRGFTLIQGESTDTVVVTWEYETRNAYDVTGTSPYLTSMYSTADVVNDAILEIKSDRRLWVGSRRASPPRSPSRPRPPAAAGRRSTVPP